MSPTRFQEATLVAQQADLVKLMLLASLQMVVQLPRLPSA
jgi:hypothetical protein